MRQFTAVMLTVLLSANFALSAQEKRLTLQEQVGQIPGGAIVKVKLKSKETVQGRLADVTSAGYTVQVASGDKLMARQITYDETKSLKQVGQRNTGLAVALGIIGGVALAFGIIAAVFVAAGGD